MASSKSEMKDFFKKKKSGGVTKPNAKAKSSPAVSKKTTPKPSASFSSDITQPAALISRGGSPNLQDDYDAKEEMLKLFDMNMAYGPCIGMNRLDRWERAKGLGLNPPNEVEKLLNSGKVGVQCLWDGRV